MQKVALLFSGGMDSFIAYHYMNVLKTGGKNDFSITPVYVYYYGRYCEKELKVVKNLLPQTIVVKDSINLANLEMGEKAYIPNRNIYLTTVASNYADTVMMGGLKDDRIGDKSPLFCQQLSNTLTCSLGRQIVVNSPFWHMEKIQVINWYISYFGKKKAKERLLETTSCYDPHEKYCGHCPSCFRKFCALLYNGIELPYYNKAMALDYYKKRFEYSVLRSASIERACKHLGII